MASQCPNTSHSVYIRWKAEYEAALNEDDGLALFKRVEIAEATMLTRRDELDLIASCDEEWRKLHEALDNLRTLKRERLRFDKAPQADARGKRPVQRPAEDGDAA